MGMGECRYCIGGGEMRVAVIVEDNSRQVKVVFDGLSLAGWYGWGE